jgi:hypothetical protein
VPTPRLNLIASTERSTGLMRLEWEYRHAPGFVNQRRDDLPKSALDDAVSALSADGWTLESQCANPAGALFIETLTFVRTGENGAASPPNSTH